MAPIFSQPQFEAIKSQVYLVCLLYHSWEIFDGLVCLKQRDSVLLQFSPCDSTPGHC